MRRKIQTVKGHKLPAPALTQAGYVYGITRYALPLIGLLLLLDIVLFALFHFGFGLCYGVLCYF